MVGLGRLERPTSPLSGVRSNHLSYRPVAGSHQRVRMMRKRNEDGASRHMGSDRALIPMTPYEERTGSRRPSY